MLFRSGTALPLLMQALSSPVWPEVLQVSDRLRARCGDIPLTWDPDVLLRAIEMAIGC